MPPGQSTPAAKLPFTFKTHSFSSEINTPPSTLLTGGKGVGSSAQSDLTITPPETQDFFTPALVSATLLLAPILFGFVTIGGAAAVCGEEANTLDGEGWRPSNYLGSLYDMERKNTEP